VAFEKKVKNSSPSSKSRGSGETASGARERPNKIFAAYIFWAFFFVLVICLFIGNMGAIQTSLRNTGLADILLDRPANNRQDILPLTVEIEDDVPAPDALSWEREVLETEILSPVSETPALADEQPVGETPIAETPVTAPPLESASSLVIQAKPQNSPTVRRERGLYLIEVDPDGTILRIKVNRSLPATDSPLVDTLNALLEGPSTEETSRGLISLIPPETRILSATVRGSTAYINFNENFLFNEYGVEGYAGQLRQIVWTATEFPNIKDVQILIEGRRLDYLGESIWIGSPVGRESR
jgi:spore germination protein GerM